MQKILVLAGPKQSGKSSAANFVAGCILTQYSNKNPGLPMPSEFSVDDNGNLIVNCVSKDNDKPVYGYGILDLHRKDEDFMRYAEHYIWPYVKVYAFAETLKEIAVTVFGLTEKQVYGTDEDKNSYTNIKWKNFNSTVGLRKGKRLRNKTDPELKMTAREFLQYFGTNICRNIDDNCWVKSCLNQIKLDNCSVSIVQDGRFSNEVLFSKQCGAKVIRFLRTIDNDTHASEVGLNSLNDDVFDLVIDNNNMDIKDKNILILEALNKWGWINGNINYK